MNRHRTRWEQADDLHLLRYWGRRSLRRLSKDLGRTQSAIRNRIRVLGYGASWQGTLSLEELSRISGFSKSKIVQASKVHGIKLRHAFGSDPRQKNRIRRYSISEDRADRLIAIMIENERIYANAEGAGKSSAGVWGVGRKPPHCFDCKTVERPHLAKGLCSRCYDRRRRNG